MNDTYELNLEVIEKIKQDLNSLQKQIDIIIKSVAVLKIAELGFAESSDSDTNYFLQLSSCEKNLKSLKSNLEKLVSELECKSEFKALYELAEIIDNSFMTAIAGVVLYSESREYDLHKRINKSLNKIDPNYFSESKCIIYVQEFLDYSKILLDMFNTELSNDIFISIRDLAIEQEKTELTETN